MIKMFALVNDCKTDIMLQLVNLHDNFANSYKINISSNVQKYFSISLY